MPIRETGIGALDTRYWLIATDQSSLTGDKSGSFDLTTTGIITDIATYYTATATTVIGDPTTYSCSLYANWDDSSVGNNLAQAWLATSGGGSGGGGSGWTGGVFKSGYSGVYKAYLAGYSDTGSQQAGYFSDGTRYVQLCNGGYSVYDGYWYMDGAGGLGNGMLTLSGTTLTGLSGLSVFGTVSGYAFAYDPGGGPSYTLANFNGSGWDVGYVVSINSGGNAFNCAGLNLLSGSLSDGSSLPIITNGGTGWTAKVDHITAFGSPPNVDFMTASGSEPFYTLRCGTINSDDGNDYVHSSFDGTDWNIGATSRVKNITAMGIGTFGNGLAVNGNNVNLFASDTIGAGVDGLHLTGYRNASHWDIYIDQYDETIFSTTATANIQMGNYVTMYYGMQIGNPFVNSNEELTINGFIGGTNRYIQHVVESGGDYAITRSNAAVAKLRVDMPFYVNNPTFSINGGTDTDITCNFIGTTNSGVMKWMEDEDYFQFLDSLLIDLKTYYRDTAIGIYSQADTFLDLFADGAVRIGNSSAGAPTTYVKIESTGDTTFVGSGSGLPYGATYGHDIAWTQASAAQNTWYLVSDTDMVDGPLNNMTSDGSGKLTATLAGTYRIQMSISMQNTGTNKHTEYGVSIDGAAPAMYQREFFSTPSEEQHGSLNRIITLTAGQTIELAVRTPDTGTPDLKVDNLSITVVQVGG